MKLCLLTCFGGQAFGLKVPKFQARSDVLKSTTAHGWSLVVNHGLQTAHSPYAPWSGTSEPCARTPSTFSLATSPSPKPHDTHRHAHSARAWRPETSPCHTDDSPYAAPSSSCRPMSSTNTPNTPNTRNTKCVFPGCSRCSCADTGAAERGAQVSLQFGATCRGGRGPRAADASTFATECGSNTGHDRLCGATSEEHGADRPCTDCTHGDACRIPRSADAEGAKRPEHRGHASFAGASTFGMDKASRGHDLFPGSQWQATSRAAENCVHHCTPASCSGFLAE